MCDTDVNCTVLTSFSLSLTSTDSGSQTEPAQTVLFSVADVFYFSCFVFVTMDGLTDPQVFEEWRQTLTCGTQIWM